MIDTPPAPVPDVPMAMLTSLPLRPEHWVQIARRASWHTTRMNLNTFQRHGVFDDAPTVDLLARRLRDPREIARARAFPYQLLAAFVNATDAPAPIRDALQDAMEIATGNVPAFPGRVWVFVDVSGSMHSPVTGHRAGATTKVRCVDVAALIAASVLRKNPGAVVLPFSDDVTPVTINPRDSVMTNAQLLASLPSGGTNCSAPLALLNRRRDRGDLLIYVSDYESWLDRPSQGAPATARAWDEFSTRNPRARLVCIDLQPAAHTQVRDRENVMNIGGFSDSVFEIVARFAAGELGTQRWADLIAQTPLDLAPAATG